MQFFVQIGLKMEPGDCPPLNINAMQVMLCRLYLLSHSLKRLRSSPTIIMIVLSILARGNCCQQGWHIGCFQPISDILAPADIRYNNSTSPNQFADARYPILYFCRYPIFISVEWYPILISDICKKAYMSAFPIFRLQICTLPMM